MLLTWSNRINEQNHCMSDVVIAKIFTKAIQVESIFNRNKIIDTKLRFPFVCSSIPTSAVLTST